MRKILGFSYRFVVVVAVTLLILALPTPAGLSEAGKRALTAFAFTGTIFALQPVPLPFAGLMVPVVLVALGLADSKQAFEPLARPIIILILGSLFIAEALRKNGITRRLALSVIVASLGNVNMLLLGLMGIAAVMSMWMENTATAAVLIPVAITISNQVTDKESARRLLVLLVLGIAYAASIGGMATLTGSASNAVASEFLSGIRVWTFLDWMKYGVPSLLVVFPATYWVLLKINPVKVKNLELDVVRKELDGLGKLRRVEWEILIVMALTISLWIGGASIEAVLGLPVTFMSPAVVGIVAVAYMSLRNIIEWEDVKGVSWGMFFAISAGLALGEALNRSGATVWLTNLVSPIISGPNFLVSLVFVVFASALLTNVVNNATVVAVFAPIMIEIARANPAFNSVQLVLPLTLATTFGYALPSASGRMALISATGIVEPGDMFKYGMIITFVSSLLLVALFYLLALLNLV
ncbi:MAG: DASS family sodium-coupled anion symporter [Candidatus Bathyarchaeota archaeon]